MAKILIVDDGTNIQIDFFESFLIYDHDIVQVNRLDVAIESLDTIAFDIVIIDTLSAELFCKELIDYVKTKSGSTQIIIIANENDIEDSVLLEQYNADDCIRKPINFDTLKKSIIMSTRIKQLQDKNINSEASHMLNCNDLDEQLASRTVALQASLQSIVSLLSSVVELRDPYTSGHQKRVGNLSAMIALKMNLSEESVHYLRIIGYIHDIGKIAIPAEILLKPGNLSWVEMVMIRSHPQIGFELIEKSGLPSIISETIKQHHERCDGSGHPNKLVESELTIESQIVMVADVIEAMVFPRTYRPALGIDIALEELHSHSGTLFNKVVVNAIIELFNNDGYEFDDSFYQIHFPF